MDSPIPPELVAVVDILSPNETELARLTNMPTEDFEQIRQAVGKCHKMVSCAMLNGYWLSTVELFYFVDVPILF